MTSEETSHSATTVLIVDDEPMVAQLLRCLIEKRGYQTVVAANGEQALFAYAAHKEHIALVIADLRMVGMSGEEMVRELLCLDPQIHIIISTTGLRKETQALLIKQGILSILPKPYSAQQLFQQMDRALA